jgi:hypothetical protein
MQEPLALQVCPAPQLGPVPQAQVGLPLLPIVHCSFGAQPLLPRMGFAGGLPASGLSTPPSSVPASSVGAGVGAGLLPAWHTRLLQAPLLHC